MEQSLDKRCPSQPGQFHIEIDYRAAPGVLWIIDRKTPDARHDFGNLRVPLIAQDVEGGERRQPADPDALELISQTESYILQGKRTELFKSQLSQWVAGIDLETNVGLVEGE